MSLLRLQSNSNYSSSNIKYNTITDVRLKGCATEGNPKDFIVWSWWLRRSRRQEFCTSSCRISLSPTSISPLLFLTYKNSKGYPWKADWHNSRKLYAASKFSAFSSEPTQTLLQKYVWIWGNQYHFPDVCIPMKHFPECSTDIFKTRVRGLAVCFGSLCIWMH